MSKLTNWSLMPLRLHPGDWVIRLSPGTHCFQA